MLLGDFMFAFTTRTVHYGHVVRLGPGAQATAKTPGHAHQVVVVQVLIGTVELTPPHAKPSPGLAHREVGVEDHPIDAIITTVQKLTVKSAQLVGHGESSALRTASSKRNGYSPISATSPSELPRRGHFFGAQSPKKRRNLQEKMKKRLSILTRPSPAQ